MTEDIIPVTRSRLQALNGRYREVSEISGLSLSYVSKFARGEKGDDPKQSTLQRLNEAIDRLEADKLEGSVDVQ